MRLFFSVALPPAAREAVRPALEAARAGVGRGVSFGKIEQLHFTLAFLGEQPESRLDGACAAGSEAVRGLRAFELSIGGGCAFPSPGRPRVLWLGVPGGGPELVEVANRLCAHLRDRGFSLEDRPFRAHLTVGRVKQGGERDARRVVSSLPPGPLATMRVDHVALVQSILGSGCAKHLDLKTFALEA